MKAKYLFSILVLIGAALIAYYLPDQHTSSSHLPSEQTRKAPTASKPSEPPVEKPGLSEEERSEIRSALLRIRTGERKFRQDGTTFQNRENQLPDKPTGYYQEFTVVTDGASNRAARRIVRGREGELYYTPDHYRSFIRINDQGVPVEEP